MKKSKVEDFDPKEFKKGLESRKREVEDAFEDFRENIEDRLEDAHLDELQRSLEKEIRQRPLLYAAFAFTLGYSLASLMRRRD